MKAVQGMTLDELKQESLEINKRIASDKRQSWKERLKAQHKVKDMGAYLELMRQLYR